MNPAIRASKSERISWAVWCGVAAAALGGCMASTPNISRNPALEYSQRVQYDMAMSETPRTVGSVATWRGQAHAAAGVSTLGEDPRASVRLVSGDLPQEGGELHAGGQEAPRELSNMNTVQPGYLVEESAQPLLRDYRGPLNLGDPGVSASLWKESRGGSDLFRDYRAWQPMDLVTITVSERAEGTTEADTSISQESTIAAAISRFFGVETWDALLNNNIDPAQNLVSAQSSHEWEGEGDTSRKGSLKAKISAMVVEVLPSGLLRIEGEKITAVNNEDEVMIISGIIRPEDISSTNEIDSSKIANMRIDYYGKGAVGDAQSGGWLGNIMRRVWPF